MGLVRHYSRYCTHHSPNSFQAIESFAIGQHHIVGLSKDRKVYSIGRGDYGRLGHGDAAELSEYVFLIVSLNMQH